MDLNHATVIQHLRELKRRVINCIIAFVTSFICCYYYAENIFNYLTYPLFKAFLDNNHQMIYTSLTEVFFSYLQLSLYMGFVLAFPIIITQLYLFIAPGLYKIEKMVLLPYLIAAPILFILGAILVYKFIFPTAWHFFLSFEQEAISSQMPIKLEARVSEYLSLVLNLIIIFGIAFQMPLLLCLMTQLKLISPLYLREKRKYAIVIIFIIAAIITPPDVFSQIALAIPMMILYELSILASNVIYKRKKNNA